jgi:hypothetical protein
MVQTPEESMRSVLMRLQELGYIEDASVIVEGDRPHSGLTDLRITRTGHVADDRRATERQVVSPAAWCSLVPVCPSSGCDRRSGHPPPNDAIALGTGRARVVIAEGRRLRPQRWS